MDDGQNVQQRQCSVEQCGRPQKGRTGYCTKHYQRWKKYGDPLMCGARTDKTLSYLDGEVGYIELTQGKWAIVDAKNFAFLNQWRWCWHRGYAERGETREGKIVHVQMNRVVARTPPHLVADHRNLNKLDNREENLRNVTRAKNSQNRRHHTHKGGVPTSSRFKGVSFAKSRRRWVAYIRVEGTLRSLGTFKNEEDAAVAYNVAAVRFFADCAYLNVI